MQQRRQPGDLLKVQQDPGLGLGRVTSRPALVHNDVLDKIYHDTDLLHCYGCSREHERTHDETHCVTDDEGPTSLNWTGATRDE